MSIFIFVWSLEAIWGAWPGKPSPNGRKLWLYASLVLFYPAWQTLGIGQLISLLLFGFVGAISLHEKRPFWAGVCLSFVTAKPHLFLVSLPIILLEALKNRNWAFISGFTSSLITLTAIALWFRPALFVDYLTPTGSSVSITTLPAAFPLFPLSQLLNWNSIRFAGVAVSSIFILSWIYTAFKGNKSSNRSFLKIAVETQLISMLVAPYGFPFDFVIFLPLIWIFLIVLSMLDQHRIKQISSIFILLVSFLAMFWLQLNQYTVAAFSWFPLVMGLLYLMLRPLDLNPHRIAQD